MAEDPVGDDEIPVADGSAPSDRPPVESPETEGLHDWRLIGRGGHGEVWSATERSLGRTVAVKVLPPMTSSEARHRFRVEASAIGRLTGHPAILSVLRSGITADGRGILVMEYADHSLTDRLDRTGPLPLDEVVEIVERLATALDVAHATGTLHLDVKPANVLVSTFGEPKLADFGLAALSTPPLDATIDDPAEWMAGMTPGYGPPELLEGTAPSVSTDVHLLAATAVALLCGHPPYARDGDTPAVVWRRTLGGELDLRALGVPEAAIPALSAGLERDPARRPASAGELARLLSEGAEGRSGATDDGRVRDPPGDEAAGRTATRRRRVLAGSLTAAALIALVAAASIAARSDDGGDDAGSTAAGVTATPDEVWVDSGLWGGVGLVDVVDQELVAQLPGQEVARPVVAGDGVFALAHPPEDGPPAIRRLDPASGATLAEIPLPQEEARSYCTLVAANSAWAACTRRPDTGSAPPDETADPQATLYRLTEADAVPIVTRDGSVEAVAAHDDAAWLLAADPDPFSEVGALVLRVDGDGEIADRLPAGSPDPARIAATSDGLWVIDGRTARLVSVEGSSLVTGEPLAWNPTSEEVAPVDISAPVDHDGGVAFVADAATGASLYAVHLRAGQVPRTTTVPFSYDTPGLSPVLAVTRSGAWWTLGDSGTLTLVGLTFPGETFPGGTVSVEVPVGDRVGPFADPELQAVDERLVVVTEPRGADVSAVIVDGTTGETQTSVALQPRSLLPLLGPDGDVAVADLWTSSRWAVDGRGATAEDGPPRADPPMAVTDGYGVVSRRRGGGGLYDWVFSTTKNITVDGDLYSDGDSLWYENEDETGLIDPATGVARPITVGWGSLAIYSGTRALIRNAAVIDGDFWRIGDGVVERARADGAVTRIPVVADDGGHRAIAASPSGDVAVLVGDDLHLVDPATDEVVLRTTLEPSLPTGYLVSDDSSLWWVALHDGEAALLDPGTGEVRRRVDGLGEGIATAAVSDGALVVAHETSGTLTRVGARGNTVTREVGPRPYWVSADDDVVVVGLQGERAVAQFDSVDLVERWRQPLGRPGPDA